MSAPDLTPHTAPNIGRRLAVWALIVIFLANFFNYMDRTLVSALEKQLSSSIGLLEWEFGLLWTLFTIGYMVCAVPIGLLADWWSRPKLFAICIVIWSVATVASGMPDRLSEALGGEISAKHILYGARVLIGIGEAGCLIVGPALISDYFSRASRGRALSFFYLGMPLGGTFAFILVGIMVRLGYDWPDMFFVAGYPGFLIAVLIWVLWDPPRGAGEGVSHHAPKGTTFADYLRLLKNRTLLLIILAQAFAVITIIPLLHYGKRFFTDTRGLSEDDASITLGVIVLIAGVLGAGLSGWIGDWLARRYKGAYALLAGIGFLAGWPCLMIGFMTANQWVYLPAITLGCFFYFLCMPAVNTQIANVVNPAQRATAWALAVFILHLLGDTLAPPVFGVVSSGVGRENAFTYFSIALAFAGACCLIAARTAGADIARVQADLKAMETKGPAVY